MGRMDPRRIALSRWRLLIADDDAGCRASLAEFFEIEGFRVLRARDGSEAIEVIHQKPVDFSVLDLNMPGLTGIEVIRLLREGGRALPSIVVSANATDEDEARAIRAGAFSLVHKPVRLDVMRSVVVRLLQRFYPGKLTGGIPGPRPREPEGGPPPEWFPKDRPIEPPPGPGPA